MNIIHLAVEKKRSQMMKTANQKGMSSSDTIKISQELDKLINLCVIASRSNVSYSPINSRYTNS